MAEFETPKPMTDADIATPPATTTFQPAAPLKDEGVSFDSAAADASATANAGPVASAKQAIKDGTTNLRGEAGDKALGFAADGKARATQALQQVSTMLNDAAGQVDVKLGEQYGQYARLAATKVDDFTASLDAKSVDELLDDARGLVRNSPGIAIGAAATVGFVVARLLGASVDQRGNG